MAKLDFNDLFGKKNRAIVQTIEEIKMNYESQRFRWERMWHENNFFDEGYHYRVISTETRQVMDYADTGSASNPRRAIPKASRQIRGIANLLLANRPMPVIYPDNVFESDKNPEKSKLANTIARRVGHFITEEWDKQDLINEKLPLMLILAARHNVSFLKIWPDPIQQAIRTQVRDAFDLWLDGDLNTIYDCPIIIDTYSEFLTRIRANEYYDKEMAEKVVPDNKYSDSKIKENYMSSRYGMKRSQGLTETATIKEAYIKEYLDDQVVKAIQKQKDADIILKNKQNGNQVIRQVVIAAGAEKPLRDVYTTLPDFPYVDFRFEPGSIYATPLLERFKSSNKSLDNVVSKLEKTIYTMAVGKYWTRDAQKPVFTNDAYGQWVSSATPPQPLNAGQVPTVFMDFIALLTSYIEEQGVTTSALGKLPDDVRSGIAIESLKSSEYANLTIPLEQLKKTIKQITERILDIADDYFITPETVYYLNEGQPEYFDIVGQRGVELHKKVNQAGVVANAFPIKKDYKVKIEIESGLGYTIEGKRANAQQIVEVLRDYAREGLIPPQVVQKVIVQFLKTFQFGNLSEITQAFAEFGGQAQMTDDQIMVMKVAMAETMRDIGVVGPEAEEKQVMTSKVGAAQAIKDIKET